MNILAKLHRQQKNLVIPCLGIAVVFAPTPSYACSFRAQKMSDANIRERAKASFRKASMIIDAEVILPMKFGFDWKPGLTPIAYLRVIRVWKGGVPREPIPIIYIESCDIGLVQKGQQTRILLSGAGVFRAEQALNGGGVSNIQVFNAELDRLVGHQRSPTFARFPGEELPPSRTKKVRN